MNNSKNYFSDGGDTLVIGGKLKVLEGAEVELPKGARVEPCSGKTVADVSATLNALIASLVEAGILQDSDAE